MDVAERIRRETAERLRLPLSVGIATSKLVSEAATRAGRSDVLASPLWPLSVPPGTEAAFLAPCHVAVLPEVPDPIRRRLDDYQLDLIGQIAAIPEADLCAVFGRAGRSLRNGARGIDPRPVLSPEVRAEFQAGHTLATDTNDLGLLHALLRRLTERLGRRLRQRHLAARRLALAVDYVDHMGTTRSVPLREAALDGELWEAARRALALALVRRTAVRHVTVTVDRLVEADLQLDLWDPPAPPRIVRLQQALDRTRKAVSSEQ